MRVVANQNWAALNSHAHRLFDAHHPCAAGQLPCAKLLQLVLPIANAMTFKPITQRANL
jgi:hypothetical protein